MQGQAAVVGEQYQMQGAAAAVAAVVVTGAVVVAGADTVGGVIVVSGAVVVAGGVSSSSWGRRSGGCSRGSFRLQVAVVGADTVAGVVAVGRAVSVGGTTTLLLEVPLQLKVQEARGAGPVEGAAGVACVCESNTSGNSSVRLQIPLFSRREQKV